MRPPYAEHYYPADPPHDGGVCDGCGQQRPALAWRDHRAPDARLCGRCVPPDVTVAYVPARTYDERQQTEPAPMGAWEGEATRQAVRDAISEQTDQVPGQTAIELP